MLLGLKSISLGLKSISKVPHFCSQLVFRIVVVNRVLVLIFFGLARISNVSLLLCFVFSFRIIFLFSVLSDLDPHPLHITLLTGCFSLVLICLIYKSNTWIKNRTNKTKIIKTFFSAFRFEHRTENKYFDV